MASNKHLIAVSVNSYAFERTLAKEIDKVCPNNHIVVDHNVRRGKVILHVRLSDGGRARNDKLVYSVISIKNDMIDLATVLKKAQRLHERQKAFEVEIAKKESLRLEKNKKERQAVLALLQGYEIPNSYFSYNADSGKFSISLSGLSEAQARSVAMAMLMSSGGVD